jgi:hypothetical protein
VESFFTSPALPKSQKRVVTLHLHDNLFGDTSNAATAAVTKRDVSLLTETKKNIFPISSETPLVDTENILGKF